MNSCFEIILSDFFIPFGKKHPIQGISNLKIVYNNKCYFQGSWNEWVEQKCKCAVEHPNGKNKTVSVFENRIENGTQVLNNAKENPRKRKNVKSPTEPLQCSVEPVQKKKFICPLSSK